MTFNWKKCKIGDLCDTISNTYKGDDGKVVLINTSDVLEGKILNHELIDNKNLKGQFKKTFQKNDILYSEIRPANKRFAFVDIEYTANYIASTKLMVIRPYTDLVLPQYLYMILKSQPIIDELQHLAETRSGTFPQITFSAELAPIDIKLPPLETQQKIARVLSAIDDKIELNNSINNNLEQQAQAIFKQIFSDISEDDLPSNWHKGTIGEIIELHDSKRVPLSGQQREKMKQKIYPYYGATSLMDYVDDYIFDGIYLLLGEDGTVIDTKGFPILQYVWGKFWVNNHAHILTGKNGFNVESLYLLFRQLSIKSIVTGAVQAKISQTNLKSLEVIIPPIEVIENLNDKIKPLFYQIRSNLDENKVLTQLRDTLLPKLMSGEIDVSKVEIDDILENQSADKLLLSEDK